MLPMYSAVIEDFVASTDDSCVFVTWFAGKYSRRGKGLSGTVCSRCTIHYFAVTLLSLRCRANTEPLMLLTPCIVIIVCWCISWITLGSLLDYTGLTYGDDFNVVSEMTYSVLSGTLNSSIPYSAVVALSC